MPTGVYERVSGDELKRRLAAIRATQAGTLDQKIAESTRQINEAASHGSGPIVCMFSGGRDSTVIALLAQATGRETRLLYNCTGLGNKASLDRVHRVANRLGLLLTITVPEMPAFEMWKALGHFPIGPKRGHTYWKQRTPDLKTSPVQCCYQLKEKPARKALKLWDAAVILWGNRADDSNRRKLAVADHGVIQPPSTRWPMWSAQPVASWLDRDVQEFLAGHLPGEQWEDRAESGCQMCCTDIHRRDNNLSRLYLTDRASFDASIRSGLGQQILHAKGIKADAEQILQENPLTFLRV